MLTGRNHPERVDEASPEESRQYPIRILGPQDTRVDMCEAISRLEHGGNDTCRLVTARRYACSRTHWATCRLNASYTSSPVCRFS
jgi:hypothetical protein